MVGELLSLLFIGEDLRLLDQVLLLDDVILAQHFFDLFLAVRHEDSCPEELLVLLLSHLELDFGRVLPLSLVLVLGVRGRFFLVLLLLLGAVSLAGEYAAHLQHLADKVRLHLSAGVLSGWRLDVEEILDLALLLFFDLAHRLGLNFDRCRLSLRLYLVGCDLGRLFDLLGLLHSRLGLGLNLNGRCRGLVDLRVDCICDHKGLVGGLRLRRPLYRCIGERLRQGLLVDGPDLLGHALDLCNLLPLCVDGVPLLLDFVLSILNPLLKSDDLVGDTCLLGRSLGTVAAFLQLLGLEEASMQLLQKCVLLLLLLYPLFVPCFDDLGIGLIVIHE